MNRKEILSSVHEVFVDTLDNDEVRINESTKATDVDEWDSLTHIMLVVAIEKKFNIQGLLPDPTLFGGGMHESRKGGYLKLHSDFIYIKKRKVKRVLNLLIYLRSHFLYSLYLL